ncbi:helix-turn-helix domain-containing protein [Nonomuraea typhae]|uniref:helix-turn-helix domain-containing protein n=1 Tax=Nonomuraea typhae TaxID=2603600 RepID=UPI0012FCC500|nr:helix-turn-helix domain-containing protein [Nonomuraea typhae]
MTEPKPLLSDPKAMRALAHPARLEMLNRLQIEGPATATEIAEVAGVTPSAASYHLRMLAKYGFVEDAPPRGDGRERVWRWIDRGLRVNAAAPEDPPELRAAKELLIDAVYDDAHKELRRAMAQVERESAEWRDASTWQRIYLRLTAEEMREIGRQMVSLLEPYRAAKREEAPEGARSAVGLFTLYLHPERRVPGLPTEDHDAV